MELADETMAAIHGMVDTVECSDAAIADMAVSTLVAIGKAAVRCGLPEFAVPELLNFAADIADKNLDDDAEWEAMLAFRKDFMDRHPELYPDPALMVSSMVGAVVPASESTP